MASFFDALITMTDIGRGINEIVTAFVTSQRTKAHSQLEQVTQTDRIVYTKYTFILGSEKGYNVIFKGIKRCKVIRMRHNFVPGRNCARKEAILVPI